VEGAQAVPADRPPAEVAAREIQVNHFEGGSWALKSTIQELASELRKKRVRIAISGDTSCGSSELKMYLAGAHLGVPTPITSGLPVIRPEACAATFRRRGRL
jgi:hypothetical protein